MDEREMTKEQAKQTIEGFTAFMRGLFNNPNLYVPEEIVEKIGVSEEFRNKTSEVRDD